MSHRTGRRSTVRWAALIASALIVSAFVGGALGNPRAGNPRATAAGGRATVVLATPTGGPGLYAVTVVVTGATAARNRVSVRIGELRRRTLTDVRHPLARIRVRVRVVGSRLRVRAVGRRARPLLTVRMLLVRPATARHQAPPPSGHSTHTTTTTTTATTVATTSTTPATVTTTSTTTAAPSAPRPQAPGPGSPFTRLVWSDDFVQDWSHAGGSGNAQERVPPTWGFDNWGGCGTTPPQLSRNSTATSSAYLTSQGLTIPVVATSRTSYRTAQLDTRNIGGESWQFGTIEASIQMPTGTGLCPAFWMLPNSGGGEIDIIEAPSFVATGSVLAPYSIFTLHVNNTQQFQQYLTPPAWNPGQPNVYGVIWTRNSITWTVNYVPYATATPQSLANPSLWSALTSGKFHLLLDDAVGGWPGDPPAGTVYSKPMTVQWVKVFQ